MKSSLRTLPLVAIALLFAALFTLDFAFDAAPEVYVAFVPVLVWAVVISVRGRG